MSREMKSSDIEWVNSIPNEWHETKLSRVSARITDFVASGSFADLNENVKYLDRPDYAMLVRTADLSGTRSNTVYINKHAYNFLSNSNLHGGEIILSNIGSVGSVFMYEPMYERASLAPNAIMVDKTPCNRYYYYYFQCTGAGAELRTIGGSSVQTKFNKTQLRALKVVVPPLSEQHQIVSFLDRKCSAIDTAIEKTKKSIEKLEEYKKAVITKAVTKGLDPDAKMKDSGERCTGEIPSHWGCCKILYVLSMPITDGPHETPVAVDEGIPFVSAEAVSQGNGTIDFDHIWGYVSKEFYKQCCKKYIPQKDDIYMIKSGATTGRVAIVDTDRIFTIWSPLAVLRTNKNKMIAKYLYYYVQSDCYQRQVELGWNYGTQQNIGMRMVERLKICVPPIKEQEDIVAYIDNKFSSINTLIAMKQNTISKWEEYKKSLIYYAVTGKIDCRNEVL